MVDLNPETGKISLIMDLNPKTGEKSPGSGSSCCHGGGRALTRVKRAAPLTAEPGLPVPSDEGD